MLRALGKGLLARLLAYAVLGLGFWCLFQGFLRPNIPLGILGGAMIPAGMFLMVAVRRGSRPTGDLTSENCQNPAENGPVQIEPGVNDRTGS
jgi:hypothetical protein